MTSASNNARLATVYDGLAAQLDDSAAILRHDLEVAEAALVHARDRVDEIRRNLDDLMRRREDLRGSSVALRSSQRLTFPRTFPVELLCAVFQAFVGETTSLWVGWDMKCGIDKHRRSAPFILAAVCRHWRTVALATPSVWYYIVLPAPTTELGCHTALDYINTVISRSGGTALEIGFYWNNLSDEQWTDIGPSCQPLLRRIADAASRWKVALLYLPNAAATRDNLDGFRRVMPMLEELTVCREDNGSHNPWATNFPLYLPYCPRLRRMRTDGCHVIWTPPHSPIALVHLELEVDLPASVVWDLLQSLPALESLSLDLPNYSANGWIPPANPKLHLHALRILGINRLADLLLSAWAAYMELPNLRSCLLWRVDYESFCPFLEAFADTITTLTLYLTGEHVDPEAIPDFRNLKDLVIRSLSNTVYNDTFLTLARTDLWPELEVVELHGIEVSADLADALIAFVRARRPKRLKTVRLESCTAPAWFSDQLELFLHDSKGELQ
ncbi:hypothetical protein EXIGLDRAFT_753654 [Exidia glandulosa HHB12029]|uniref:Uncharacterized protein n=1 Tax=Exidia glandulosa HHB12029 TaxID=1314781 RepID=A0A165DKG7_EXIGL|nr:hypothetical protein EXIGLDRAFT_753654 [Exidia glandulosa HHB12029]